MTLPYLHYYAVLMIAARSETTYEQITSKKTPLVLQTLQCSCSFKMFSIEILFRCLLERWELCSKSKALTSALAKVPQQSCIQQLCSGEIECKQVFFSISLLSQNWLKNADIYQNGRLYPYLITNGYPMDDIKLLIISLKE